MALQGEVESLDLWISHNLQCHTQAAFLALKWTFPMGLQCCMVMATPGISNPSPGSLAENILQAPLGSLNYWRERAQDALLGICCFILCLLGRCGCSFWLVEMKARLQAQPCPAPGWRGRETEGTQGGVGVDSHNHGFYTSLWQLFPQPNTEQSKEKKIKTNY